MRGPLPGTSLHQTWSRPKCNTFSLSEELFCFLCSSSRCGGTRSSPGGPRSDGSGRYSSPGGEWRAWVPVPELGVEGVGLGTAGQTWLRLGYHCYHEEGNGVASRSREARRDFLLLGSAAQSTLPPSKSWRPVVAGGWGRLEKRPGGQLNLHRGRELQ